jgi:SRSO17 transposase
LPDRGVCLPQHGHAFIGRRLYLPKAWTDDPARMAAAHVPPGIGFATKPAMARAMIERAITAEAPFAWVAAGSVCGVGGIEAALRKAGKGYVPGVNSNHVFASWGKPRPVAGTALDIAQSLKAAAWRRLSAGDGTKGPRLHDKPLLDWALIELADREAADHGEKHSGLWTRGLLIRRHTADCDLAFFSTWRPAGTRIETLVPVEGRRWAMEDSIETAKNELGLDQTRSWHGWHRHVSLVMLAIAMTAAIHRRANAVPEPIMTPPKTKQDKARPLNPLDPLVSAGNPPHRRPPGPKANSARPCHRMVPLAKSPSSSSAKGPYQKEIATVTPGMGSVLRQMVWDLVFGFTS